MPNHLEDATAARIREMYRSGVPMREIARTLGVSRTTVRRHVHAPIIGRDSQGNPVYGPAA